MAIVPGTTPTLPLSLPEGYDISDATQIYVSLKSETAQTTKYGESVTLTSGRFITVKLSQEDTLAFPNNSVAKIQVNWIYADGTRGATVPATVVISEQLLRSVLPNA